MENPESCVGEAYARVSIVPAWNPAPPRPSDPPWVTVFAEALSEAAQGALFQPNDPAWRSGWDYTPLEALEATEGWSTANGRDEMKEPDRRSLIADVTRGFADLQEILGGIGRAEPVDEFLTCLDTDRGSIDWDSVSSAIPAVRETLQLPEVRVAVWDRASRRFARQPGRASSWRTLATLDGVLRVGEFPRFTLDSLARILREDRPDLAVNTRLTQGASLLELGPSQGHRVAWLMILDAACSPWVINAGSVTFFDGGWFASVYANDLESRSEIPPEVIRLRASFDPSRLGPLRRDDDPSYVLARVDLGHGPVATAESTASAIVQAVVSLSKLAEDSKHWRMASGCLLLVDEEVTGFATFVDFEGHESDRSGREIWLDSLSTTAPEIERVLTGHGEAGWVLADATAKLLSASERAAAEQLTTAVESSERLLRSAGVWNNHWAESVQSQFGSLFAVTDYRRHLARLTMSAYTQVSRDGTLPPGHGQIVTWRGHDLGVDVLAVSRRIDEVVGWAESGTAVRAILEDEARHIRSPALLQKRLRRDVEDYRRVFARARRVRNAVVHGGHVEGGGLSTCPAQMMRSARQLAFETFHAYASGLTPSESLASLRLEFDQRISALTDSVESIVRPVGS